MSAPLDVVMVVRRPVSAHGGVERVVRGLLEELSAARPAWRLSTATAFPRTGWLEGLDGVADVVAALRLGRALRRSTADVLLLHAPETAWGVRLLRPRRGPRPSLVVVWHGAGRTPHLVLRRPGHPAARALAELRARLEVLALPADGHVVVHSAVLDVLRAEHGHTGGAVVVENTLRAEQVRRLTARPAPHPQRPTTALWLGQAGHRKGLDVALEALARARRSDPDLRLVVAGVPAGPPVEGVEQVGVVAPEDVPALLHRCDLLLFPTRYEAFSIVVLEALVAGLPAVVSDVVPASVVDGTNGRRITGHDPDDYAAALLELRDPAAYAAAVAATAGAAQRYGPEAGTAAYVRVLEQAAEQARRRRAAPGTGDLAGAPVGAGETGTERAPARQDGGARAASGAPRRSRAAGLLPRPRRLRSREPSCPPPPPPAGP